MYHKNPKTLDTQKSYCKNSIILIHLVMDPQDADRMVNNVDPDQVGLQSDPDCSLIWVYTVCPALSVRNLRNITVFVSFSFQFEWKFLHANSVDHDQTAQNAASDRGLNCFPKP